jgi:hypothetical protein
MKAPQIIQCSDSIDYGTSLNTLSVLWLELIRPSTHSMYQTPTSLSTAIAVELMR